MAEESISANSPDGPTTAQEALAQQSTGSYANLGNPVFSCLGKVDNFAHCFTHDIMYKTQHPFYETSSNSYGELQATPASCPSTFHGISQKFSQHLGKCGMYRNHSLNTAMDRSKVYDRPQM